MRSAWPWWEWEQPKPSEVWAGADTNSFPGCERSRAQPSLLCATWTGRSWTANSSPSRTGAKRSLLTLTSAEFWTTRASTRWSSRRPTTGTRWRRSGRARPAKTFMSRSRFPITCGRAVRWWRRPGDMGAWSRWACRIVRARSCAKRLTTCEVANSAPFAMLTRWFTGRVTASARSARRRRCRPRWTMISGVVRRPRRR